MTFIASNADDTLQSSHKKLRPKPVVIAEHPPEHIVSTSTNSSTADQSASTLGGNKDHLETKKQIEMMRKQHGDSWLQNHGAKMEQLSPQLTIPSAKRRDENSIEDEISNSFGAGDTTLRASTPINPRLEGSIVKVTHS